MKTKKLSPEDVDVASSILKAGGLVAIPTETVYGLAANALSSDAVAKIFKAKGRPMDNPLIVHIAEFDEIHSLVSDITTSAKKLADAFWPGPLTMILPKSNVIPDEVSAGLDTVAIRMPSHELARKLINLCDFPLAAPSANLSGKPSPTCARHVIDDLYGKIDAVLDGGCCTFGLESTVLTLCSDTPKLLRPGKITVKEIENVIGKIEVDQAVLEGVSKDAVVSSPGMKYKHYSPNSDVIMIIGPSDKYVDYVNSHSKSSCAALCFEEEKQNVKIPSISYGSSKDYEKHANLLFNSLRKFDDLNVQTVFAHCCSPRGVGLAVYNRLVRAAGFKVVNLE